MLAVVTLGADSVTLSTEAVDSSSAYQASTEPRELEGPEVLQSTERLPQSQLDDEMPILGQEALALVPELTSLLQPDSIGQAISSPLSLEDSFAIAATDSDTAAADMPVFVPVSSAKPLAIPPELTGQYLDDKQRYQLKQPLVPNTFSHLELEASVIDCRPADPPPLAELAEQLTKVVEQSANQTETLSSVLPDALPASALPYLLLQSNFFPAIPELHSAWQSDRYTVLVLEQRDHFGKLLDYWKTEETEALQQVHWCYEMSELWQALAPYQGQPSLLNIENLRIDEDQILCLQRLFFQSASTQYTLRDLGLLWQVLLQQVSNALSDLVELARDLGAGKLESVQALQSRLVEVADRLSQSVSSHEANLEPESNTSEMVSQSQPHSEQIDTPETPIAGELELLLEAEELLDLPEEEGLVNDSPTMVLPMILVELNEAGQTHVGQQREHNEDTFCIKSAANKLETPKERQLQAKGMYILCDGMGGHESGEVASALAVETLQSYFSECWQSSLPSEDE
ncbi:MAG: hypothetical protein HC839_02250, partial [Leptolyngbyaceae cyanobacterium RM2_2_21]|nr:hypothetical protein [Leptolyngbyaceae cyanobacterium RM2_2_21]